MSSWPNILVEAILPPAINSPNLKKIYNWLKIKARSTWTGLIGRSNPVVSRSKKTTVGPLRCLPWWWYLPPLRPDISQAGRLWIESSETCIKNLMSSERIKRHVYPFNPEIHYEFRHSLGEAASNQWEPLIERCQWSNDSSSSPTSDPHPLSNAFSI